MKKLNYLIGLLFLGTGILPSTLPAQQKQEAQTTEVSKPMEIPAPVGGLTPQLVSPSESDLGTVFTAGVALDTRYEDNATTTDGSRVGHYQYSVMPNIGFQGFGRDTQWILNYAGGVTFDQRALQDILLLHRATADFRHAFSKRLAAEAREEYIVTNNPFARIGTSALLPGLAGPGELSSFVLPPTATRTASVSMASLSYQLGPHSGIGINGNFSMQRFRDVVTGSGSTGSLVDTKTTAGRAFFVSQISQRQTIGAEYQIQDLNFLGLARVVDHTVYLFDAISLGSEMKLSLFAGPEQSHIHNVFILNPDLSTTVVPFLGDQLSWAGGLMYTWQGKHTGARVSGQRGVSDGGGFLGATRLNTGLLELQTRINERWTATLGTSYSDGRSLDSSARGIGNRITVAEGHAGIERRIMRSISLRGQYAHVYQPHGATFIPGILGHHNQVEIALEYLYHRTFSQ